MNKVRVGDSFIWNGSCCEPFVIVGGKYKITQIDEDSIYFNDEFDGEDCVSIGFIERKIIKHIPRIIKIIPNFSKYSKKEAEIWEK